MEKEKKEKENSGRLSKLELAERIFGEHFENEEQIDRFLHPKHSELIESGTEVIIKFNIAKSSLSDILYEMAFDKRIVKCGISEVKEKSFEVFAIYDNSSLNPKKIIK